MTLLPLEDRSVRGFEGKPYPPHDRCANPSCTNPLLHAMGLERHHMWRRSFLAGDFWWVTLPDGGVVGNCVWLCFRCHQAVTENKARIVYSDGPGGFQYWVQVPGSGDPVAWKGWPLDPQPPVHVSAVEHPLTSVVAGDETPPADRDSCPHTSLSEGERCTCGYRKPYAKKETSPKSEVKAFRVPKDQSVEFDEMEWSVFKHLDLVKDGKAVPFARNLAVYTGYAAILNYLNKGERAA
jgi:hypothetical protein